ncbi:MAG TPA: hypothetical protein DEH78_26980, partial [Solibacterales bacterium]|nr:hypothetical protein [Bryobacterales bacterium]
MRRKSKERAMEPGFCPSRHEKERMLLLDYCSGELEPVEAAALRGHIEGCPDCAAWVEAQERVVAWMGEWEAPAVSAGFDQALAVQMAGERPAPWWRRWFAAMELRPAAAVAAVCVILAAGILLDRMPSPVAPEQAG